MAVIHGFCEHAGRYEPLVQALVGGGYEAWSMDYRGHGQADGRRGHVDEFSDYLEDLQRFVSLIREQVGERRIFLLGHSLGGLILADWLIEKKPEGIAGAIFSAPYLQLAFQPPWYKLAAARLIGRLIPFMPLPNGLTSDQLTSDPQMQQAVDRDPLYNHTVTPSWFRETANAQALVRERAGEILIPSFVMVPESDPIASPAAGMSFEEALGSSDKDIRLYSGARHEVFNEVPETRQRAMADVLSWLGKRSG